MWVIPQGLTLKYCVYEGLTTVYPSWFANAIVDHVYTDEFGYSVYDMETLVEDFDVFLLNGQGEIRVIDKDTFNRYYAKVSRWECTLKETMIECFMYHDAYDLDHVPEWFIEALNRAEFAFDRETPSSKGIWYHLGTPLRDPWVALRNKFGEIRCISVEAFKQYYKVVRQD